MTTPITFPIPARFGGGDLVMRTLTFSEAEAAVLRAEVPGLGGALRLHHRRTRREPRRMGGDREAREAGRGGSGCIRKVAGEGR